VSTSLLGHGPLGYNGSLILQGPLVLLGSLRSIGATQLPRLDHGTWCSLCIRLLGPLGPLGCVGSLHTNGFPHTIRLAPRHRSSHVARLSLRGVGALSEFGSLISGGAHKLTRLAPAIGALQFPARSDATVLSSGRGSLLAFGALNCKRLARPDWPAQLLRLVPCYRCAHLIDSLFFIGALTLAGSITTCGPLHTYGSLRSIGLLRCHGSLASHGPLAVRGSL
jgi:hypothetical protein